MLAEIYMQTLNRRVTTLEKNILLEIYKKLKAVNLVTNQADFSTTFCKKHKGWMAYQTHKGRDFSIGAAISCLSYIKQELELYLILNDVAFEPLIEETNALTYAENTLRQFLAENGISEVK
jgi:hypothetical protein